MSKDENDNNPKQRQHNTYPSSGVQGANIQQRVP